LTHKYKKITAKETATRSIRKNKAREGCLKHRFFLPSVPLSTPGFGNLPQKPNKTILDAPSVAFFFFPSRALFAFAVKFLHCLCGEISFMLLWVKSSPVRQPWLWQPKDAILPP
jgi:hypothetical protein